MDDLLDHIAAIKVLAEDAIKGDFYIQMPINDWHTLRKYMLDEYDIRHRQYCDFKREHYIFQGIAMVAGDSWKYGEME